MLVTYESRITQTTEYFLHLYCFDRDLPIIQTSYPKVPDFLRNCIFRQHKIVGNGMDSCYDMP